MIVVDASVLIALLDAGDAHHANARSIAAAHASEGFLIHPVTLAEVLVGAVRNGRGTQRVSELTAMGVLAAEPDPTEPLFLAELRVNTGLPLPDCCVLSTALSVGASIATFDARLGRAAASAGLGVIA